jgi:hypothetical protein
MNSPGIDFGPATSVHTMMLAIKDPLSIDYEPHQILESE